jgi:hypothetical protein
LVLLSRGAAQNEEGKPNRKGEPSDVNGKRKKEAEMNRKKRTSRKEEEESFFF